MKKFSKACLALAMSLGLIACAGEPASAGSDASSMKDGTYESKQAGFGGDVFVTLTVKSGKVTEAVLVGDQETENVGKAALETLSKNILDAQSAEFDGVSGATVTSNAVKAGVQACLDQANGVEAGSSAVELKDGTYTAESWSFATNMPMTVSVEVKDGKMASVEVVSSGDTDIIMNTAVENLIPQMIEHQSVKVDATTGATVSSNAIKAATEDCLKQAIVANGGNESAVTSFYVVPEKSTAEETIETDILVVGLGGAGITTATRAAAALYEANDHDASKVHVLGIDKAAKYGGTSVTTTSPMSVNPSVFVEANGGEEYVDAAALKEAWIEYTEGDAQEWAIDVMMNESGPAVDWLVEQGFVFGAPEQGLSAPYKVCVNYGAQFAVPKSTVQTYFDSIMSNYTSFGGEYMLQVEATDLIKEADGSITGVHAVGADGTSYTIHAKYVVLSTGGFAGNGDMEDKYLSNEYYNLAGGGRYNCFGMTQNDGKMIESAIENGASTYNIGMPPVSHIGGAYKIMHDFPVVETENIDIWTGRNATMSLNDIPMMLAVAPNSLAVNRQGVRFTDETTLAAYGNWQAGAYYYTIWSDEQIKDIQDNGLQFDTIGIFVNQGGWPSHTPIPEVYDVLEAGIAMDYIYKADTLEELAEKIGVDASTFTKTVADYNTYCDTRENPADGITKNTVIYGISGQPVEGDYDTFAKVEGDGPYYAVKGSPWIYSTVGALNVNEDYQVLDTANQPMTGLYAAGTDCLGMLFTEEREYVTYGGADQGWAFTSGYMLGQKLADQLTAE